MIVSLAVWVIVVLVRGVIVGLTCVVNAPWIEAALGLDLDMFTGMCMIVVLAAKMTLEVIMSLSYAIGIGVRAESMADVSVGT